MSCKGSRERNSVGYWQTILEKEEPNKDSKSLLLKAGMCGLLAGDGSVSERRTKQGIHREVRLFADDKVMERVFVHALKTIYDKTPSIRIRDNVTHIRLTSKTVVKDLLRIGQYGTHNWRVPHFFISTRKRKAAWLKGFFSGEAYVGPKQIKIQTVNQAGMKDVSSLLNEFKIEHKSYIYKPNRPNYHVVHIIFINKKDSREKYYEEIGFWHSKKTASLKKTLCL